MSERDKYEFEGGHYSSRTIHIRHGDRSVGGVRPASSGEGWEIINSHSAPTFASQRAALEWLIDRDLRRRAEDRS